MRSECALLVPGLESAGFEDQWDRVWYISGMNADAQGPVQTLGLGHTTRTRLAHSMSKLPQDLSVSSAPSRTCHNRADLTLQQQDITDQAQRRLPVSLDEPFYVL